MSMYNNRAINALRSLGIWIPGDPVVNKEGAFSFWAEVFGWEAEATSRKEKLQRFNSVKKLVEELDWSSKPEFRVFTKGEYYYSNLELVKRFWVIVEHEIEAKGLSWYWVRTERNHKGLCWGDIVPNEAWVIKSSKTKKTPQREPREQKEEKPKVSTPQATAPATPQGGRFNSIDDVL